MTAAALHFSHLEVCTSASHTEPVKRDDKFGIKHFQDLDPSFEGLMERVRGQGVVESQFKDTEYKMFLPFLSL